MRVNDLLIVTRLKKPWRLMDCLAGTLSRSIKWVTINPQRQYLGPNICLLCNKS